MNSNLLQVPKISRSTLKLSLASLLLLLAVIFISTPSNATLNPAKPQKVGYISLVIGNTTASGPNRKASQPLKAGSPIYLGDIITTQASGHAHLHFIDGALMSLRPHSRLTIQEYNYDAQTSANSRVTFELEEGTARSISGKAAKEARENFRLNTPLAAIGVRGTDFIVHTSQERTRALVTEGGIVFSGLEETCQGAWCTHLELTGGNDQLLEMDLLSNEPRLMRSTLNVALSSTTLNSNLALAEVASDEPQVLLAAEQATKETKPEPIQEVATATTEKATPQPTQEPTQDVAIETTTETTPKTTVETIGSGELANNELVDHSDLLMPSIVTEQSQIPEIPPQEFASLVWGHLGTNQDELPKFVQANENLASLSNNYDKTEISNQAYGLFSRHNEFNKTINPNLPVLNFELSHAAAWLNWHAYREPMDVGEGMLSIDFNSGAFSTQLQLYHKETGQIYFNTSGSTSDTGHFTGQGNNKTLEGIVSLDGKEAAYQFEEKLPRTEKVIDGITHWDIKK